MSTERVLEGRSIVGGCAIGQVLALGGRRWESVRLSLEPDQIDAEIERLGHALTVAGDELERTHRQVVETQGDELAAIFDAQHLLLWDPELRRGIEGRIREHRVNAEWALTETIARLLEKFSRLESTLLRERAEDLRDVGRAMLRALSGDTAEVAERFKPDEAVVVLAHDLTPSEAIRLSRAGVLGFGLEAGGQTSHTAIIARSLSLPMVAGLAEATVSLSEAGRAIVDGDEGRIILDPSPETVERYRRQVSVSTARTARIAEDAEVEAVTQDGVRIHLMANIDLPDELPDVGKFGAEGIGLYRSEFLFIERSPDLPGEDEQVEVIASILEAAAPNPAVIRTFDLGGRKLAQEVIETHEDNPVLGLRGIRLTLRRRDIFKAQVRAILRAGVHGRLRVLLPMVTAIEEIHEFRQLVEECELKLSREGLAFRRDFKLGAMVEVPAAALIADRLARQVDFLSLGTNDLVQYTLAVDRGNEHVAYLYQPLHPAILRMVRFVADAAADENVPVTICGEVAADPRATGLLLALGLRHLSMTPRAIPMIKKQVRSLSLGRLDGIVEECLQVDCAADVEAVMRAAIALHGPGAV